MKMKNVVCLITFALFFSASGVTAQNTVKGIVYEDVNYNGRKDSRERDIHSFSRN